MDPFGRKHVSSSYIVKQIEPFEVDRAYPLVEPVAANLSLSEWRGYCALLASGAAGQSDCVWIASNPLGIIQGLAVYGVDDSRDDRSLEVPIFVVTSAADDAGVSKALIDSLKDMATERMYAVIRFWTLTPDNWSRWLDPAARKHVHHGVVLVLEHTRSA
jgi:hypothetical protein